MESMPVIREENRILEAKYRITSKLYDVLDYPWERQYRLWRPRLLSGVRGSVIEVGVGTGRNLPFYHRDVEVTGIDLSKEMLRIATGRSRSSACTFHPVHEDASAMASVPTSHFDWLVSTYLCCVMSDQLQSSAIEQFSRVLKPGGRFRLLEMVYSENPVLRRRQEFFAPFVEIVYGARFDRQTLAHIEQSPQLRITGTHYLKADVYLVIDGICQK